MICEYDEWVSDQNILSINQWLRVVKFFLPNIWDQVSIYITCALHVCTTYVFAPSYTHLQQLIMLMHMLQVFIV